jgi:enoyl-CoA hydratase/carnithine racemase
MIRIDIERREALVVATLSSEEGIPHLDRQGLEAVVDALESAAKVQGVERLLIRCDAPGGRLLGLGLDAYDALGDREQALAFARAGEAALARLGGLPARTLAWIEGPWLGEACELALACDVRIASSKGTLGLPQPGIGHVPGWGGVVRLVRLTGPSAASWILTLGSSLRGERARRFGVLDAVTEEIEAAARTAPAARRWPLVDRLAAALPLLRRMALGRSMAGGAAEPPARDHLPRLVQLAVAWPEDEALDREGELFADTVSSPEARALRQALRRRSAAPHRTDE